MKPTGNQVARAATRAAHVGYTYDELDCQAFVEHCVRQAGGRMDYLGTNAMAVDQKMDESRLQFKLAAAEARDSASSLSARDAANVMRAKADEAMEAAKKASQDAKLNAEEAANAVKLAAKGTAERTAELLRLEQLAEELQIRSEEFRARTQKATPHFGKRRMLRAFPKMKHGEHSCSLDSLREQLKRK